MSTLIETLERIREERKRLRSFPKFEEDEESRNGKNDNSREDICKISIENSKKSMEILKEIGGIDRLLEELKRNEPSSDNKFFRLSIIAYEMGDFHRSIVYAERFKDDEKARIAHLANGKLALADALTQLYLLCLSLEWDFDDLRELGALHLQERHEDFKRDGWSEVK